MKPAAGLALKRPWLLLQDDSQVLFLSCTHAPMMLEEDLRIRVHSVGQQFPCGLDLAVGHSPLPVPFADELASGFETSAGALDCQLPLHLHKAGHDMKEEPGLCGQTVTSRAQKTNFQPQPPLDDLLRSGKT